MAQSDGDVLDADGASVFGRRVGAYELRQQIGAGGMGVVYRAHDTRLRRDVAIKMLPRGFLSDAHRSRFEREARLLAALNHPNIAAIYGFEDSDAGALVMELVAGRTLAERIQSGPLALPTCLSIACQIASALKAAHAKGIAHRDLKPANVMVTPRGRVKVLDFGLAKGVLDPDVDSTITATEPGTVMGTVAYMSPEQALGRPIDHRTDIFSFGVVLYEMASGRRPFIGISATDTIDRIVHSEPERLARLNPLTPPSFELVVQKCLEKERERRYQSAGDLLADLKRCRRGGASPSSATARREQMNVRSIGPIASSRWMRGAVTVAAAVAAIVGTVVLVAPMTAPSPDASSTATAARSGSTSVANASPIEIQFNAEPRTVAAGGTTALTWNVKGASEVSIDGIGRVSNPGRQTVAPPGTSVYRLNATRGEVQRSASVEVVVTPAIRDGNRTPVAAPQREEPTAQAVVVTQASRPREGRVVWTGRLAAGELLRIHEGKASMGELTAPLPERVVTVQVSPDTVKVVSQTARDLVLQNMGSTTEPTIIIRWTDSAK